VSNPIDYGIAGKVTAGNTNLRCEGRDPRNCELKSDDDNDNRTGRRYL